MVWVIDGENCGVTVSRADVLHVCFPWQEGFVEEVEWYRDRFGARGCLILIHSTVHVGTTSQIENAVHCPVRGAHPNLDLGMKTFVRYAGGPRAEEAKQVLLEMGCPEVVCVKDSRVTEALKLWDTTYYAWNVVFEKAVHAYCERHGLDFNLVYTHANTTYKEGYEILHKPEVARPILEHVPGPIGGHCLIPNCRLLDDDLARFILERQELFSGRCMV